MSLRDPHGPHRELHVQWADEVEAHRAFLDRLSADHDDELDSSSACDDEAWSMPPRKVSRVKPYPSMLQQVLPTPPDEWRRCHETLNYDNENEEKLEWRDDANNSASSCSSGSTCSGTYSSDDDETASGREDIGDRQAAATIMAERGLSNGDGDDALVAAPVHASSCLLSQGPSPLNLFSEQASKASADHTALTDREACALKGQLAQHPPSSPSLSPEVGFADITSPQRAGRRSGYSVGCAFAPSDLSPQPDVAVCRSTDSDSSYAPSPQHNHHSSTAVHEPRARCGCRGLTVRVDSGPLGLSLEASYRMEQGFVLKQAWSDCAADSGMFTHSVHVQNLPGKRDDGHIGALDLGLKGRSSSSGLIKVRRVGLESGGGTSSRSNLLVGPPLPRRPGNTSVKETRRSVLVGVLEVEEGDILVRVDDVQVRTVCSSTAAACWEVVVLLCRFRGKLLVANETHVL